MTLRRASLLLFQRSAGSSCGDLNFLARADFDRNGTVHSSDGQTITDRLGETCF